MKVCLHCSRSIRGRADKKFCDDQCRNAFNNSRKSTVPNTIRNINNRLLKNRQILQSLIPPDTQKALINREKLELKGYLFSYHTHTYVNHKGNTYHFCYEYGYLPLQNGWLLLVKGRDE
ncbi:MAG: hypothetical protein H7Y31_09385 [Chitinophagaceae bacterium]|nr:hypothetical protein [Chitinophagaceae bacterium]